MFWFWWTAVEKTEHHLRAIRYKFNSLNAMGTFMCPYEIEKSMYFILTPNIKSLVDVLKLGWERVNACTHTNIADSNSHQGDRAGQDPETRGLLSFSC